MKSREWQVPETALSSVVLSSDGQTILTGSTDGTVRVWRPSIAGGDVVAKHAGGVGGLALSPDGSQVLTSADSATATVWSLESGGQLASFATRDRDTTSYLAAFSPDGKRVIVDGPDIDYMVAQVWDIDGPCRGISIRHAMAASIWSAEFSPDGRFIVTAGANPGVAVWDAHSGKIAKTIDSSSENYYWSASFSTDGRRILGARNDGTVGIWASNGQELVALQGHIGRVTEVCFFGDGERVFTACRDHSVRIWDASTGCQLFRHDFTGDFTAAAAGETLALAHSDGTLQYWARRRPEYWWGIAWLPEFWIGLVSGTALLYLGCCSFSRRFQTSE